MKHLLALILLILSLQKIHGQNRTNVSLVGSVLNFDTSEKLLGATLYFMQNGKTVSKSISDELGRYSIVGNVLIDQPIDLLVSKPGFTSKKVLFDIKTIGNATNVQLLEELVLQLHENCEGANLGFTKTEYAEKFKWDVNVTIPDKNYKEQIDKRIIDECAKVEKRTNSKTYISLGDKAYKDKQFKKATSFYDSALAIIPGDSAILVKKNIVLDAIKVIKEEEAKKAKYNSKKTIAMNSFNNGDLVNAEKIYKEILLDFPGDVHATGQIAKIITLKNQQELERKNEAETNKLIAQANTLKSSKKFDEAISKLQQAIALAPSKKDEINIQINEIKALQSDLIIETEINKNLKVASDLFKNKKYDEAINTYKSIDLSIIKLSNQLLIDKYSNLSKQGAKSVIDKKNQEGEEFKKQLKKAQDNFDKGPAFYNEAEKILKGDPMKSRMNDPDVKKLSESIVKMKDFYKQKNDAYKEIISKASNESALAKLKSARNVLTKLGSIAPTSELPILNKSIDSLETIINPKKNPAQSNNNGSSTGNRLKAPGELVMGNPNDVIDELSSNVEAKKEKPYENLTDLKNDFDNEVYFNSKLKASRQEDEMRFLEDKKTEIELRNIDQSKTNMKLQEDLDEKKRQFESDLYEKKIQKENQNDVQSNQIQNWKNETDNKTNNKLIQNEKKIENDMARIDEIKNSNDLKANNSKVQNEELAQSYQKTKTETEYRKFKQDSLNAMAAENRSIEIQKMKDFQKENKLAPNHIADENGVEFPWNKMTERIYKVKNKEGFITSIITRRIVVDKNGYGIVYEQTTNESGVNSFTKNGSPITEFIWANESTGINVIEK